ncbi:dodecin domain-containing protein [Legionella oakridgensis]|uniref:Uncharacterized protein n=2 Tax=Legionella oakridgensis TaxID=29423 RepID=W0B7D6_9GAMM|nr:dodecin domain-containing protein [Legionella oakridgensis]AHE65750.1 hypothetical protein Loa_00159 [Legionella oakridgensis ATCC 33761 = DSM 21215]ETO94399.1 dodecin [Legionella oakridgensis RV-2-2007]KTD38177.1 hypothetical protein Loak_1853 [Legionella oakridgensis]STY15693.1 Uncharacterised protein [Legionella longbeachae]
MIAKKIGDFTGYSNSGIYDAIQNALEKAGEHVYFEVIETCCSQGGEHDRQYQVTLATFGE